MDSADGPVAPSSPDDRGDARTSARKQLPSGRHGLSRAFVLRNQRERMLAAVAEVVSHVGYSSMTVSAVIAQAGVSRRTFYEHFSNKEDVFLAAYDHLVDLVLADVSAAYEQGERWTDRVRLGLEAFVTRLAQQPALAHVCVVEVLAAGPRALARRSSAMERFRRLMTPGYDESSSAIHSSPVAADAVIGGIYEVIYSHVLRGDTARLPALAPDLLHGLLVPFVGVEDARRASRAAARNRPGALRSVDDEADAP